MTPSIRWLTEQDCANALAARPRLKGPFLVYSSLIGGWTDSPLGLTVSLDDHGFHRGDGAFEAIRIIGRKPYLLKEHWDRLQISLRNLSIPLKMDFETFELILSEGIKKYPEENFGIRMFVTRGPGGFSPDFRECIEPQFFCVLTSLRSQPDEKFKVGVRLGTSKIPLKPDWLAVTKSLNYLPNVMMKMESVDAGLDFTVAFDHEGHVAESATENLVVLTRDGTLAHPPLTRILKGCTMVRLFDLVEQHRLLPTNRSAKLTQKDLFEAQGLYMVGTTLDALPVREYDGKPIPLSEWGKKLNELLRKDQNLA